MSDFGRAVPDVRTVKWSDIIGEEEEIAQFLTLEERNRLFQTLHEASAPQFRYETNKAQLLRELDEQRQQIEQQRTGMQTAKSARSREDGDQDQVEEEPEDVTFAGNEGAEIGEEVSPADTSSSRFSVTFASQVCEVLESSDEDEDGSSQKRPKKAGHSRTETSVQICPHKQAASANLDMPVLNL